MGDGEEPNAAKASGGKWDWSNPQTVLAVIGIIAGLGGSVFGVAMAAPYGQDLLCQTFNLTCPRTKFENPSLSINAIDFDSWCDDWLEEQGASDMPPPGYTGSKMDCSLDFSIEEPANYSGNVSFARRAPDGERIAPAAPGGVASRPGVLLVAHLSMEHPVVQADTPFTLRVVCRRGAPEGRAMAPVPCQLSPPRYNSVNPFDPDGDAFRWPGLDAPTADAEPPLPAGAVRVSLRKDELDFIQRWRLDIDGQANAALQPGLYSVEIAAGAPGESVEPVRIGAEFEVYAAN